MHHVQDPPLNPNKCQVLEKKWLLMNHVEFLVESPNELDAKRLRDRCLWLRTPTFLVLCRKKATPKKKSYLDLKNFFPVSLVKVVIALR